MNDTNKNFQYIVLGLFILFAMVGVGAFVIFGKFGGDKTGPQAQLLMWGLEPKRNIEILLDKIEERSPGLLKITYIEKESTNIDQDLLEALASGIGPDLILLPHDRIWRHMDKIYTIPYDSYKQRTFKDTFLEEGEMFMRPEGIIAFPFSVDPLVMYWNRQLFTDAGIAEVPKYWDEFFGEIIPLTELDSSRNIRQSAVAFGEYDNVNNAKEILSALILQSGDKIVDTSGAEPKIVFGARTVEGPSPAESSLRFYTEFSNPTKQVYSWNKSLPTSKASFLASDLAIYFGFASEAGDIAAKNPNLNFDVASIPQIRDSSRATYGRISGLSILKNSEYIGDAFLAVNILTSEGADLDYALGSVLPPVHRKLLSKKPSDASPAIFYDSAIISKGWFDPNKTGSDAVFEKMIENVTSGRFRIADAVIRAKEELELLLR